MLTIGQAVTSALRQYATFSGRARRSEYWWFYLFTWLVSFAAGVVDSVLRFALDLGLDVLGLLAFLLLLLPSMAVTVRRLHDTNRTGWWMWLPLPPLLVTIGLGVAAVFAAVFAATEGSASAGPLVTTLALLAVFGLLTLAAVVWLVVMLCQDSEPETNRYGPSPKRPWSTPVAPGYYPPAGYYGQLPPPAP